MTTITIPFFYLTLSDHFSSYISLLLYSWSFISLPLAISSYLTIVPSSLSMATCSASHNPRLSSYSSESSGTQLLLSSSLLWWCRSFIRLSKSSQSSCSSNMMFPGIHSKIGPFFINGCLSSLNSSSNLVITSSIMGNYVHIKPYSLCTVLRDMK